MSRKTGPIAGVATVAQRHFTGRVQPIIFIICEASRRIQQFSNIPGDM